jgi:hypothetical protein
MCGETSAILVAVAADFFLDGRHLKVPTDAMVGHVPRCVDNCKVLDWKRSRISMLDVGAVPQSWMP